MARTLRSEARTRAGIELAGRTLRYAEVELPPSSLTAPRGIDPGPRLLRLGACDFDFDVEHAVFDPEAPTQLETVARAIEEIYRGSAAERLGVAVHAWNSTSFFAPLAAGMPAAGKLEQLRQEAAMLADVRVARSLQVSATPSRIEVRRDGREYHWHHVLRVREAVQARFAHLAGQLRGGIAHMAVDAAGAAAEIMARLRTPDDHAEEVEHPERVPYALGLGFYDGRLEISLSRGSLWHYGHWASAAEIADAVYFGAALLDLLRVDARAVRHLYAYGDEPDMAALGAFESLLSTEARPLNPMPLFRMVRSQADPQSLAAFAPCVGAALKP